MKYRIIALCLGMVQMVSAKTITGTVTGTTEGKTEPLVGATVYWAGTAKGTVTDLDGNYSIEADGKSKQLVASFVGFDPDTMEVKGEKVDFALGQIEMEQVEVRGRRMGSSLSRLDPLNTINMNSDELCKAACCNLGESFETNASVDVSYSDATTGAKTIQLLGLNGRYVQMLTENVPNMRGISSAYSLSYVPGPWMNGIQVSKGVGTVVNGFEAFTGQINVDYKKPVGDEIASANVFTSSSGRYEVNGTANIHFAGRLSTGLMVSASTDTHTMDEDGDKFRDEPEVKQINILNRWNWSSGHGYTWQLVGKYLSEERTGGSVDFGGKTPSADHYGVHIKTDRLETWMKNGFTFEDEHTSFGIVMSYIWHKQNSFFGLRSYDGTQHSYSANVIFQTGNDMHQLHAGLSAQGDFYRETVGLDPEKPFENNYDDLAEGGFAQYTLVIPEKLTVIAGLRLDHQNHFGAFVTPRLHVRYTPDEHTAIRIGAGKGYRTAALFAENNYLMASSRRWDYDEAYVQEKGWNYGISLTKYIHIFERELTLTTEYYRTQFDNQLVANYDVAPSVMRFDNVKDGSYSNTFQIEGKYQPVRGLEVTAAWRLNDAKQTLNGEKRLRPLTNRYKGLVALSYATPLKQWQFDVNMQMNGGGRIPTTEGNPEAYRRDNTFGSYQMYNGQITKYFRTWSIYAGAENIGNFTQKDPIIAGDDPYGKHFDGTMVWGPLMTRKFYVGLRWSLEKD